MKRHTVVWVSEVLDDLAEIWMASGNREQVGSSADEIDRALSVDPIEQGGELSEGLRFIIVPPLRVLYSVRHDDLVVEILRVREI